MVLYNIDYMRPRTATKQETINCFLKLESQLGKQPSIKDFRKNKSLPSPDWIQIQFGGWMDFLKAMGKTSVSFCPTKNGFTRKGTRNKTHPIRKSKEGYVWLFEPEHPLAIKQGYVLEHRKVVWDAGIQVKKGDVVHHKNNVKDDNKLENLLVCSNSEHTKQHKAGVPHTRSWAKQCRFNNCLIVVASQFGLCQKHYRKQWLRRKRGLIKNLIDL